MLKVIQLDGWKVAVNFGRLKYGDSFFIPSANWEADRSAIEKSAQEARCEIAIKGVVEGEIMGLRAWCTRQADFD